LRYDEDHDSYKDSQRVMSFLEGLGEAYNVIKTYILLTKPFPGINRFGRSRDKLA